MWVACPKKASADSITVSASVGCAWMVIARSVATAAISIASVAFGDHLAGADADDPDAEHALGLRVEDDLGQPVGATDRRGAAGGAPRELGDLVRDVVPLGLAAP